MCNISMSYENSFIHIQFNSNNIHISDSFRVVRERDMKRILMHIRSASLNRGIFYSRNTKSWIREWKAHNVMYKLGVKRAKDVNLNEKQNFFKKIGYFILSLFCCE